MWMEKGESTVCLIVCTGLLLIILLIVLLVPPSHWKVVVPVVCDCDCECGADEVNTPARF